METEVPITSELINTVAKQKYSYIVSQQYLISPSL